MAGIRSAGPISDAAGTGPATLTAQVAPKMVARLSVSAGTPSVAQALNVSSVTDNAVGNIIINFSSSFANANFTSHTSAGETGTNAETARRLTTPYANGISSMQVLCFDGTAAGNTADPVTWNASANGDLA